MCSISSIQLMATDIYFTLLFSVAWQIIFMSVLELSYMFCLAHQLVMFVHHDRL
jgi:hypothetical protein